MRLERSFACALASESLLVEAAVRAPAALTRLERAQADALAGTPRLEEWLRGRAALKRALCRAELDDDTAHLPLPSPRASLSHAGKVAVACVRLDEDLRVAGVGIDLERDRPVSDAHTRFFLTPSERAAARVEDRLRLWTVKEALFKADPDNAGTVVGDYEVLEPRALEGEARSRAGRRLRYRCLRVGGGWLTLALSWRDERGHQETSP